MPKTGGVSQTEGKIHASHEWRVSKSIGVLNEKKFKTLIRCIPSTFTKFLTHFFKEGRLLLYLYEQSKGLVSG